MSAEWKIKKVQIFALYTEVLIIVVYLWIYNSKIIKNTPQYTVVVNKSTNEGKEYEAINDRFVYEVVIPAKKVKVPKTTSTPEPEVEIPTGVNIHIPVVDRDYIVIVV